LVCLEEGVLNITAVVALVYGVLVFGGGYLGYRKAGSRPSMISGALSGMVLLIAAVLSQAGISAGPTLAMGTTFLLLAFFGYRFVRGRKFMPAGLMALASLATLAIFWTLTRGH